MKIIILGAGRVGESVAESLVSEQNDITVIDHDPARCVCWKRSWTCAAWWATASSLRCCSEAGAQDADMVIACAAADESNLVVCKVAHDVFNVPTTIARLRSPEFVEGDELLGKNGFAVDHVICPEESVTRYIHQLISYPEALQVLEFSQNRACLIVVRAAAGGAAGGPHHRRVPRPLSACRDAHGGALPAGHRDGGHALTRILPGDEVFVLADTRKIRLVLAPSTTSTSRCSA
jgi:trk system potassium uptake protein